MRELASCGPLARMSRTWRVIHALVIATHSNHARPSGRRTGPVVIGPAQAGPGTRSKSPASQSRQRGRDLETVFYTARVVTFVSCNQNIEYHTILEASRVCSTPSPSRIEPAARDSSCTAIFPFCTSPGARTSSGPTSIESDQCRLLLSGGTNYYYDYY